MRAVPLAELLLTFGAAIVIGEGVKLVWGLGPLSATIPSVLDGPLFSLFGAEFPRYRAFMMASAIVMLGALYLVLRVSKTGLIVRAALTHRSTVETLGHDVPRVFTAVFAVGTALAALAGVIGAPLAVVEPGMVDVIEPIVFVVVVIGGIGSLSGALVASLLIGCAQTFAVGSSMSAGGIAASFGVTLVTQPAPVLPYLLLVAMLALRAARLVRRARI